MRLFTEFSHIDTPSFLLEVTGVEFVTNGLRHVVAPLSLLKWHCVSSV
jgi:hypothetical protein